MIFKNKTLGCAHEGLFCFFFYLKIFFKFMTTVPFSTKSNRAFLRETELNSREEGISDGLVQR